MLRKEWGKYLNDDENFNVTPDETREKWLLFKLWQSEKIKKEYDILSDIAVSELSIPPASSKVETMFSIHSSVFTSLRRSFDIKNLIKYVFIMANEIYAKMV